MGLCTKNLCYLLTDYIAFLDFIEKPPTFPPFPPFPIPQIPANFPPFPLPDNWPFPKEGNWPLPKNWPFPKQIDWNVFVVKILLEESEDPIFSDSNR
jgi:hypothetical protein